MLNLQQKQKLQAKLSPQQIQYIKLLQLPTLALEQRIKEEMEENPLLEEGLTEAEQQREQERLDQEEDQAVDEEDEFDWDELLNSSDDLYGYKARVDYGGEEDDREMPMPARSSVIENLRDQLALLGLDEREEVISGQIIGSIDEDGYLRRPLESIIDDILFNNDMTVTEEQIESVLYRIQRLEPNGIGARDLRECLLVQVEMMSPDAPGRDMAMRMLDEEYEAFTMKHFGKLGSRLEAEDEDLKEAFDLIRERLDPKPGEGDFTAQQNYITPDFTVRYLDGDFHVTLNGRNAPQLHISRQYRKMLEKLSAEKKKKAKGKDPKKEVKQETRQFLKSKYQSAQWFINSINQRRNTMSRVMHTIIDLQEDFFKYGEGNLKPMILKNIAEIVEMDISTISRVVNGKYVQTDFGVYELKYFFSEGLETESGEDVSNKEVKAILLGIVENESKSNPLSDQSIADLLEDRGLQIARRTVTKYREQLSVPVARLRKQIVLEE